MKIAILDSGIDEKIYNENRKNIECYSLKYDKDNKINILNTAIDTIGHGSAVFDIIQKHIPKSYSDIKYIIIKIFRNGKVIADENMLCAALEFIDSNLQCDVINISMGISVLYDRDRLFKVCNSLCKKRTIIISSFDNIGAISFPAAFESVIGITSDDNIHYKNDFNYYGEGSVNVGAYGNIQKLAWLDGKSIVSGGNSFACAHISGLIGAFIASSNRKINIKTIREFLKKNSHLKYQISNSNGESKPVMIEMEKVAIFPFSKEMHSLIRFQDLLTCKVAGIYDLITTGRIGASTNHLLQINQNNFEVKNICEIKYDEFDTFILGHTRRLKEQFEWNGLKNLISNLLERDKKIYSFDDLSIIYPKMFSRYELSKIFTPSTCRNSHKIDPFGKLYRNGTPIIGVFGTGSNQGKFSLQLILRNLFQKNNYAVGQIGSEPTSLLFGFNSCIPFGYESTINLTSLDFIQMINSEIYDINKTNVDVIICGSQSGSITYDTGNLYNYPIYQTLFLMATDPDIIILCVNTFDKISDIMRTIQFIESCANTYVVALCVYPMERKKSELGIYSPLKKLDVDQYSFYKNYFFKNTSKPVYMLGDTTDMNNLFESLINYLSQ